MPQLDQSPNCIVSMSAIHHLDADEKRSFFARCHDGLAAGGRLINGDEIRPASDDAYRAELLRWEKHMLDGLRAHRIPDNFADLLAKWRRRNIEEFFEPKQSGDDCHETTETQLDYLRAAGFAEVEVSWQHRMWAVMVARKP